MHPHQAAKDRGRPPFSLDQWLPIAIAAADALGKLHQSGIIHQNIRPQTLRIDGPEEGVILTDADLGQLPAPSALRLPAEALPYMAPEQTGRLDGALDQRADLYSLGIVLYELRAGTLPFQANDPIGWVYCHVARAPRPLAEAAPDTPAIISDIIMKLLAKSPDERYQSARGLAHDLQRCLSERSARRPIDPFPLGARDVWDKLRVASRMYGRDAELAALRAAVERVRANAGREMVLITGPSGIGKSALVRELQRESGGVHASFLWGKFENNRRDIPYATLGQAFQDLIRRAVTLADAELAVVREQLKAALGENGRIIVELIPQAELLIGQQPPIPPLPAAEARGRFHATFRCFLGVFATRERPLVLFLDDLQWADFASLELVQQLITHADLRSVVVIGSYRHDDVDASHPLSAMLSEVRNATVPITSIALEPLAQADLTELVLDVFRCERDDAKPLASLLWAKTNGNPFFAVQLLGAFHEEHLIRFDPQSWSWQWDIAELEAKGITEDMVDLVLGKVRRLPEATLDVLMLAACIGSDFSVQLLSTLSGKAPEEVRGALEPALMDGLLLQRAEGYKFLHDRVLQAAYSLIPPDERAALHSRLGWLLLDRTPDAARGVLLFDIVNQLNRGAARAQGLDERRQIAELNLRAGRRAKATSAAKSAANYFTAGIALLPEDDWDTAYALIYSLHLELAECEYLCGRFSEAERLCTLVLEHARTDVDRTSAYRLQVELAVAQVDSVRAVEVGLTCLSMLGVDLPASPTEADLIAEIAWVREKLKGRAIEDLIRLPDMTDPSMIAALEALSTLFAPAMYVVPTLGKLISARMVHLSILHGNAPASPHGYVALGTILCSQFREFHDGYRFGKLALELAQRPGFGRCLVEVLIMLSAQISVWSRPLPEALDLMRRCGRIGHEAGKLSYVLASTIQTVTALLAGGDPLDAAYQASQAAYELATNAKFAFLADNAVAFQRFIFSMRGHTERIGSLSGEGFDEGAFEAHLRERNIPLVRLFYFVYKHQARYLARDYAGAEAACNATKELLSSGIYCLVEAEHCFYAALTDAALYEDAAESERAAIRSRLSAYEEQLRQWAESCPDTFSARHALVAAEIARVDGRDHDASLLYDKAIRGSRSGAFVQIEALASERASLFFVRRGFATLPAAYLREARSCYTRWGAHGKVRQLEALHPDLLAEPRKESSPTTVAEAEPMDNLTAAKASAAISSEMAPDELLASLMRILIEHAGAQRACLFIPSRDELTVAAEITSDHEGVRVDIAKGKRLPSATAFPLSMVHYVRRMREKVILDDVVASVTFSGDAYLATSHPKSTLCAPIVRRGTVAGILYLENKLVRGVFTPRRLALLEFLSAISLENALLAADLARETAERTQTEKTLQQSEQRLQRLVETANVVPWEADRSTGRFTYVGPQVVKMLGYPQEAWLNPGFLAERVHPEDRESTRLHLVTPSHSDGFDFRMTAGDGRTVWLHNVVSMQGLDGSETIGGFLFDITERKAAEATLKEKLDIIEEQQTAIRKLSTPIIEVWDGVLTMPVLGILDELRAEQMMTVVLDAVKRFRARHTIIDLTGVDAVDTKTADHIMKIVRAVQLLGGRSIVVGIRPEVAQTIVALGVDLSSIATLANLREALLMCMRDQQNGLQSAWR